MSLNVEALTDAMVSAVAALGYFERINLHEPKRAQAGAGLTAACWVQRIAPVRSSGLASTSGRVEFTLRIYCPMLAEPQDAIDPDVLRATDAVLAAFSGDFTLGGAIREVDLLGQFGNPLSGQAGYIPQDGRLFRVMDITLPLIINDIWNQEA